MDRGKKGRRKIAALPTEVPSDCARATAQAHDREGTNVLACSLLDCALEAGSASLAPMQPARRSLAMDTSLAAEALLIEHYRNLEPYEKVSIVNDLIRASEGW